MGTDNIFHKRKKKSVQELSSRLAKRRSRDSVLIVCEGSKTEPNYFHGLKHDLCLNDEQMKISGRSDPSPTQVVSFAKKLYKERNGPLLFDKVFCVFDKNHHSDYEQALLQIKKIKLRNIFRAITSVPSFEYYILLHYKYSTTPYNSNEKMIAELKKHMPKFHKAQKDIFSLTKSRLENAKRNAKKSLQEAQRNGTDNPSTTVHELVEYLQTNFR